MAKLDLLFSFAVFLIVFGALVLKYGFEMYEWFHEMYALLTEPLEEKVEDVYNHVSRQILLNPLVRFLSNSLKFFGGLRITILVLCASVLVWFSFSRIVNSNASIEDYLYTLFTCTTFGAFVSMFIDGISFDLTHMIGAGFASFVSMLLFTESSKVNIILSTLYNIVFTIASAILGTYFVGFFSELAAFCSSFFDLTKWFNLFGHDELYWWICTINFVLYGGVLLFLLYWWFAIMIVTAQEYFSSLYCGLIPGGIFVLISVLFIYATEKNLVTDPNGYFAISAILFVTIITEHIRIRVDKKLTC